MREVDFVMKRVNEIIKEQKEMIKGNTFNFGFIELNSYLSYVKENGVITLFGYPAMGKTSFVLNIVNNISKYHKTSILYITTEEREEFLTNVLLSVDSSIPLIKIQKIVSHSFYAVRRFFDIFLLNFILENVGIA